MKYIHDNSLDFTAKEQQRFCIFGYISQHSTFAIQFRENSKEVEEYLVALLPWDLTGDVVALLGLLLATHLLRHLGKDIIIYHLQNEKKGERGRLDKGEMDIKGKGLG